ncbi:hypothetical protein LX16_3502 [Stackebrandtia albiflava]|uniref:Glyoxalase-like domain-containing protein n=1 Tax=Stackebrandtia albiflava TaxID=406432 RepID=A0A562V4J2_9ACTN|nr:VOC family protein [Stackebrandtia albiflava]TWJ12738.1 hypothetical protein LX16_3502 [Stackebrandtia albiflava]
MALRWYSTVVESVDHRALGAWWAEAIGWDVLFDTDEEVVVVPPWAGELGPTLEFAQRPPGLVFVPVTEPKRTKNRLHLDFAPHVDEDRDAVVARLIGLGARRVDVGQPPEATWDVLADPEGNEFCVLSSREV